MKLVSWGGAGEVTGSMHMIITDSGKKLLIDCGLLYEKNRDFVQSNLQFPFSPNSIDVVILTHAHLDHSGNLPNLIRQGYEGRVICTSPTKELIHYLLEDSLQIQLNQLAKQQSQKPRKGQRKKKLDRSEGLLYTHRHIEQLMEQCQTLDYGIEKEVIPGCTMCFYQAGHILGAASVLLKIQQEDGSEKSIGFSGDIGNWNAKLTPDPEFMPPADYLVCESTYGGRTHSKVSNAEAMLLEQVKKTCVDLRGKLIIPAFSVGRTQAILFTLHQLYRRGELPEIPIYTDSPLAIKTTGLYHKYSHLLNKEARDFERQYGDLFDFDLLHTLTNPRHSDAISTDSEPCVIVSAAGMLEGGRIQQHVRHNISNPFSAILIAGFCAVGTFGHTLLSGISHVRINKKDKPVMAQIRQTDVFSAHPDHHLLLEYVHKSVSDNTRMVILVHAEPASAAALQKDIRVFKDAMVAVKGQEIHL